MTSSAGFFFCLLGTGTPALISRGFIEEDFEKVAEYFDEAVQLAVKVKAATKGKKLVDFKATLENNAELKQEIAGLRHEVEEFAKAFPTIGFESSSMKYKD